MTRVIAASEGVDDVSLAHFVVILQNVEIAKYTLVATSALFVYDWFLTIDEEVFLIWPSRWGLPKVLFFLNRYLPIVDLILLVHVFMIGSGDSTCLSAFRAAGGTIAFGFVVAQLILTMRTWAIWARRTWVSVLLAILVAVALVVDIYILTRYLGEVSYVSLGVLQDAYNACPLHFANRLVFVDFVVVMVTETVMLALLAVKALEQFEYSRSTLMVRMFKDGVIYFIFILLTSIANLVTVLSAPVELHDFLIITQRVLHSIFCSRVLLHIRGAYPNQGMFSTTTEEFDAHGAASGSHYAFRRPMSGPRRGTRNTFELGSFRLSVFSGETRGAEGSGWGMGRGYDDGRRLSFGPIPSPGQVEQEQPRSDWEKYREVECGDPLSATSREFSPLEAGLYYT